MDRLTKILLVMVAVPLWGIWLSRPAQSEATSKVLTAEKLVITDSAGRIAATLGGGEGKGLAFYRKDGKSGLVVGALDNGSPGIIMTDGFNSRAAMMLMSDGTPTLNLWQPGGKGGLMAQAGGTASKLELTDKAGVKRAALICPTDPETPSAILILDKKGEIVNGVSER